MTDLQELIQYWKDNLTLNYTTRTPQASNQILNTIKYLTELNELHKIQRLQCTPQKPMKWRL